MAVTVTVNVTVNVTVTVTVTVNVTVTVTVPATATVTVAANVTVTVTVTPNGYREARRVEGWLSMLLRQRPTVLLSEQACAECATAILQVQVAS